MFNMFKLKRFAFPTIALLLPFVSVAQAVIDLNEVIRIGLENNYDLKITRNEQRISDNNQTLGNAGFLPSLGLSSGYSVRESNTDQYPADGNEAVATRNSATKTLDAGLNLNWTLFEGFKVQTNHKRLQELKSVGELNTRLEVENFIAGI